MGTPDKMIGSNDPAWSCKGDWSTSEGKVEYRTPLQGKFTESVGAEGTLTFTGSAVVLVGPHSQKGGRADVYLDERKAGQIEFYVPPRTNDDSLCHFYGLKPGEHTLRVVTTADADSRSQGKEKLILGAITFR